jgi:hypothetical protein
LGTAWNKANPVVKAGTLVPTFKSVKSYQERGKNLTFIKKMILPTAGLKEKMLRMQVDAQFNGIKLTRS